MNVLVTGGHGFVGSHLTARLVRAGHRVRILARASADLASVDGLDVEVVRGDVTDPAAVAAAVAGTGRVYHLAAALCGLAREDLFRVNEGGTRVVAAACAAAPGARRLVVVSSLAAGGPSPGGRVPRTEALPDAPLTWYGESKRAGELAAATVAGLDWVAVRPPIVFGPRETDVYGYVRIARRGLLPVAGFEDRHYSLIYVDDLVDALVAAGEARVPAGSRWYVAGPEVVSWEELGRAIAAALGVRARVVRLPDGLASVAGAGADLVARLRGRAAIFSSQKVLEMLAPAWVCSSAKAEADLGWRAATPLADALGATVRWYRDHGWL